MRAKRFVQAAAGMFLSALIQSASAGVFDFDFAIAPGTNPLASEILMNGVSAHGFYIDSGQYKDAALWRRNESHDHGLGICSEGTQDCIDGKGDVNEISNQEKLEVLRLALPAGKKWTSLWVSSLDDGGSGNNERGTLFWSNNPNPDLANLPGAQFKFAHSLLNGAEEANLFALASFPVSFDPTIKYLFFRAGPNNSGVNNDYLVWRGTLSPVPEPSAGLAILMGCTALAMLRLRRRMTA